MMIELKSVQRVDYFYRQATDAFDLQNFAYTVCITHRPYI